jgi:hypothetical protein
LIILSSAILYFVYQILGHYYSTIVFSAISGIALRPTKEWIVDKIQQVYLKKEKV